MLFRSTNRSGRQTEYRTAEISCSGFKTNYLSAYPNNEYTAEMYRVLGDADYHFGKYHEAMGAFEKYLANNQEGAPRRDALYMLGLSYYHSGVYTPNNRFIILHRLFLSYLEISVCFLGAGSFLQDSGYLTLIPSIK